MQNPCEECVGGRQTSGLGLGQAGPEGSMLYRGGGAGCMPDITEHRLTCAWPLSRSSGIITWVSCPGSSLSLWACPALAPSMGPSSHRPGEPTQDHPSTLGLCGS